MAQVHMRNRRDCARLEPRRGSFTGSSVLMLTRPVDGAEGGTHRTRCAYVADVPCDTRCPLLRVDYDSTGEPCGVCLECGRVPVAYTLSAKAPDVSDAAEAERP